MGSKFGTTCIRKKIAESCQLMFTWGLLPYIPAPLYNTTLISTHNGKNWGEYKGFLFHKHIECDRHIGKCILAFHIFRCRQWIWYYFVWAIFTSKFIIKIHRKTDWNYFSISKSSKERLSLGYITMHKDKVHSRVTWFW